MPNANQTPEQPPRARPQGPNVAWSMDFVSDQAANRQRYQRGWWLACSHGSVWRLSQQSLVGTQVVNVLRRIGAVRRAPKRIYWDNESEAFGHLVDLWACANGVVMEFSRPGRPTNHAFIEALNPGEASRFEPARV